MEGTTTTREVALSNSLKTDLDKLALASRILEMEGHGNYTLGHVALRDPDGRGFWLKRWGLTMGEVFDWTDFQLISMDGKLLHGDGKKRHSEWPLHAGIYKRRAEVMATAHTHPHYGAVFSASNEPLRPISNAGSYFREPPPRFTRTSELVRKAEVGDEVADVWGDHPALFLRNHGVMFCGRSIEEMTIVGVQLETACREMLMIKGSGLSYSWPDDAEQARKHGTIGEPRNIGLFFRHFSRKLAATQALGHPSLPRERPTDG
jgi:ribulose-5-phosphate 4-epimerase/fuculose-1-phosphate aldolase